MHDARLVMPGNRSETRPPARRKRWPAAALAAITAAGLAAAVAPSAGARTTPTFTQTNLVASNSSYGAKLVDPNLTNAWGLAAGPGTPIWVSDHNSGKASVYSGGVNGGSVSLDLTVPVPGGNPTGQVFNSTTSFPVGGTSGSPAVFIVDSDAIGSTVSGEIEAWNGGSTFVVEDSPTGGPGGKTPAGAIFKGLALTTPTAGPELLATDVHNARVDVFNHNFNPVRTLTAFKDPGIPSGYTPYGIQNLGGKIYVTYGKQNATKTDVMPGPGLGFVDVYSRTGKLLHHLVSNGPLNAPWGLAIGPSNFGTFAGALLVGNLGNGWINAFNPTTGAYLGALYTSTGPVVISGLWGLRAGSSAFGGKGTLVFSAGPNGYADGLLGTLTPH
ncbi:MAG TPA: TIGR03118 family protein [Streptosporangiaceae bacterium]|nr:TIGR03118 family protein [Streptosporangiaceae bacterium]